MSASAAFIGVGYSAIDRTSDRGVLAYALDAALDALAAAGVERGEVDGYVGIAKSPNPGAVHADGADEVSAYLMTDSLGLGPLQWVSDVSGFAINMAVTAAQAIRSGECSCVLGVRAVYNVAKFAAATPPGKSLAWGADQYKLPFGSGPGGTRYATRMRRYLALSGARRADVWHVVSASRLHARGNPVAYFRGRDLTLAEYLDAPMVADPLCLYDCDMPVCGAGAFVMVSAERAAAHPGPAAWLRAQANWTNADSIFDRAGLSRGDIQVCQLYDGYSFLTYEWLERLGWCDRYTAWKLVSDGETGPGGGLPVNTFGGNLGEGRLHGIGHLREGIAQVMGTAGVRQVPGVRNCLVQIGPFDRAALAVLSADPA